jgi:hypothetical protein
MASNDSMSFVGEMIRWGYRLIKENRKYSGEGRGAERDWRGATRISHLP